MMNAYLPGFENISSVAICEWMFELSAQLSGRRENENKPPQLLSSYIPDALPPERGVNHQARTFSESSTGSTSSSVSKLSTGSSCDETQIQVLLEMFPAACALEVRHCLCVTDGDVEAAAQMLLVPDESKENSVSIPKNPPSHCLKKKGSAVLDDKCVKDQIVQKYSYIDLDEDKKTFRPPPVKKEPKKMVRYLDGRIVTTKGERFTEIKKEEDEDQKKTYVNLKPARQYRFH
ncbi:CUE domain-containing protein 2-like isoform X2 [Tubulanus polymorphus]